MSYLFYPISQWPEIQIILEGSIDTQPVVIHRETKSRRNPFGVTNAYGYQDLIFEVSHREILSHSLSSYG